MTKSEIFKKVETEVLTVCANHDVPEDLKNALVSIIERVLKPRPGGATINVEEVTKSVDGVITEMQCSLSGVFLPATAEYFYEAKDGKGINGLKRLSRPAEAIRKQHAKKLVATEKAIMADVFDDTITPAEGKAKSESAKNEKPDYTTITA